MPSNQDVSGAAALAICESLLLCLGDRKILPENEVVGILKDAITAHESAGDTEGHTEMHDAVAAMINGILAAGKLSKKKELSHLKFQIIG
jgi:hypothetical protein